jgi:hypothetical protein
VVSVNVPGDGPRLFGEFNATATLFRDGVASTAQTLWRLRLNRLEEGGTLHATVTAQSGLIGLAWDGEPQRLEEPATPVPPTAAPGLPATGADMTLTLGGGPAALPQPVSVSHIHLFSEPLGPLDPQVRVSVVPASRLRPGDMIAVAGCEDGWRVGETRSLSLVQEVQGNRVVLAGPIRGAFARGRALVYQDECFFFQTAVKRRDDLMNQLYHCSLDYKVSALLEDPLARSSAVLVRQTREELTALGASRAAGGHPGVGVVDVDPVRGVN